MVSEDDHDRSSGSTDRTDGCPVDHEATRSRQSGAENDAETEAPHMGAPVGRRGVLTGITGVAAGSLTVGAASASDHASDVPEPTIEGPIEGGSATGGPQTAAVHDLESYGYIEEEYFFSGTAQSDSAFGGFSWFTDEAEYETRALVYQPTDPAAFNGHLLVDWMNVTTGTDVPVTWANAFDYLMREGYAVAAVSAQAVGVDSAPDGGELVSDDVEDLVSWDPERYGDLHHPGDEYALDIFSQVVERLRHGSAADDSGGYWWTSPDDGTDPLSDLDVEYVIATGQSQSAGYMASLIDDVQPEYGNIDAYLPAASVVPNVRDDLVPVLWLNSENEAGGLFGGFGGSEPPEDAGQFRLWEVAGASHVNYWLSAWSRAMNARDFGSDATEWEPAATGNVGERTEGKYGDCRGNYFPFRYAYSAALEALRTWLEEGSAPDSAPRIEREDGSVVTDEHGNAKGGVRLPPIDVPIAEYDARSCDLEGQTFRFGEETLEELYGSADDYVAAFDEAVDDAVERGYLLPADAAGLQERAASVSIDSSQSGWFGAN